MSGKDEFSHIRSVLTKPPAQPDKGGVYLKGKVLQMWMGNGWKKLLDLNSPTYTLSFDHWDREERLSNWVEPVKATP